MLRSYTLARAATLRTGSQRVYLSRVKNTSISSFSAFPASNGGLYDASFERDSCGVGLVAHLKKQPSRDIVVDANEMLVRMSHRGGCGCEPNAGDGAGMLVGMPHSFYSRVVKQELGKELGPINSYGAGIVFMPQSQVSVDVVKRVFREQCETYGFKVIGWRHIQTGDSLFKICHDGNNG